MKHPITTVASVIFLLVAAGHGLRLAMHLPVTIGSLHVPLWISAVGAAVTLALSLLLWREAHPRAS